MADTVPTVEDVSSSHVVTVETSSQRTPMGSVQQTTTTQEVSSTSSFLEDDAGHQSSMRLMSIVALFAGIVFGLITLLIPGAAAGGNGLYLTTMAFIAAFAPKTMQKFIEMKYAAVPVPTP